MWDGLDILLEHDGSGTLLRRYTHGHTAIPGVGSLIAVEDAEGNVYFYHLDPLGGIHRLTDIAQAIAKLYEFGPFGRMLQETGSAPNEFVFPGTYLSLVDLEGPRLSSARLYDAIAARFGSRDARGSRENSPYVPMAQNITRAVDPSGLEIVLVIDPSQEKNEPLVRKRVDLWNQRLCDFSERARRLFSAAARVRVHINRRVYSDWQDVSRVLWSHSITVKPAYARGPGGRVVPRRGQGPIDLMREALADRDVVEVWFHTHGVRETGEVNVGWDPEALRWGEAPAERPMALPQLAAAVAGKMKRDPLAISPLVIVACFSNQDDARNAAAILGRTVAATAGEGPLMVPPQRSTPNRFTLRVTFKTALQAAGFRFDRWKQRLDPWGRPVTEAGDEP